MSGVSTNLSLHAAQHGGVREIDRGLLETRR
jgi:hypothetical protein